MIKPLAFATLLTGGMLLFPQEEASSQEPVEKDKNDPVLRLSPVVVSATRAEQSSFDLPVSVDVLEKSRIQDNQARVNLSEILMRVPGIVAQNRQNYAQDLQISSRGFGARAAFGVRGVRLIADGIPVTNPDGQGQAATFNSSSASRIEVLRGPFSTLYGNASGGVIQVFTEDGPQRPAATASVMLGSHDTRKTGFKMGGQSGKLNYILDLSRFDTNGYRDHSSATRDHFNGKFRLALDGNSSLTLVINALDQPDTQDPLGLSKAQAEANPRQADPLATQFNTRKSIAHNQQGMVFDHRLNERTTLRLAGYLGRREVTQYQAFQGGSNTAVDTSSGGVVSFDRDFGGLGLRWVHATHFAGWPFSLTAGIDYDKSEERRRGFTNMNGVAGALKRDEDDAVASSNAYLQAQWQAGSRWIFSAGLGHANVKFDSRDHFIAGINPDDSGQVHYSSFSPVVGAVFRLSSAVNLYASAGKGFETPTFNELFYKPDGTPGLNFGLRPGQSKNFELGVKAFSGANTRINLAVFQIDTRDEIVVATSTGGRTTFRNAGKTARKGLELLVEGGFGRNFNGYLALSALDASFKGEALDGKKLLGVPRSTLYGELSWKHPASGFSTALEARWSDKIYVNDSNSEFADAYTVVNWRAGFEQKAGPWHIKEFVRIDNLFDIKHIGSVIVGETNNRFYEPAPKRNFLVGLDAEYRF